MESIAGVNNWKLTVRREAAGVTILRASTCDTKAALPETLWGLPVTALGDHALAPGAAEVPGEEVTVTCGAPGDQWDNRALEALTLPPALERVGDYAFLNCGGLKSMALHDAIRQWGGGALMNCRSLDTFRLTRLGPEGDTLAYFADELSRELDVTIVMPDGETARLIMNRNQLCVVPPKSSETEQKSSVSLHIIFGFSQARTATQSTPYPVPNEMPLEDQDELSLSPKQLAWPRYLLWRRPQW